MQLIKDKAGFSLLEVMIVTGMIGILTGIALYAYRQSLPSRTLRSTSRDVYSALMDAKVKALRNGESVAVWFDTANRTYTMFRDNGAGGGTASDGLQNGAEPTLNPATSLPAQVIFDPAIAGDGVNFTNNAVIFSSRGLPINPAGGLGMGTVGLQTSNLAIQQSVIVSAAGRISIQ